MSKEAYSSNFEFLGKHDRQLVRLGMLAERYFQDDPNTCLIKLRQVGELLAQEIAARFGLFTSADELQSDLLRRLKAERAAPAQVLIKSVLPVTKPPTPMPMTTHLPLLPSKSPVSLLSGFIRHLVSSRTSAQGRSFRHRNRPTPRHLFKKNSNA
jgi:hypothetical protein